MKNYEWIIFDADDTLFHFDAFAGLQLMFSRSGVTFTAEDYETYQVLNKSLWVEYQNAKISAQQLQQRRFSVWAERLVMDPADLNHAFMQAMADICSPIEGAVSLLNTLKGNVKLGIITNGFVALQDIRLQRTGLKEHFDILVISEQIGVAKPHRDIFDHAITLMGNPDRQKVLMVGDNPDADIVGGINAGLDTCWLNRNDKTLSADITPNYQVSSLWHLEQLLYPGEPGQNR